MTNRRKRPGFRTCAAALLLFFLAPLAAAAQAERSPFHVAHYNLDAELLPDIHQLRARARLELVADEPLASLTLYLNRNLKVEKVADPKGRALTFEQTPAGNFRVDLPQPAAAGQNLQLDINYVGAFDPALRPERAPMLAAIAPGRSFLLPASRWFPQSANAWDRFTMTLAVTLPAGETPLASGAAEAPQPAGTGKQRRVFRVGEPALAGTLVAGRYEKTAPAGTGAPVTFYLLSASPAFAESNALTVGQILTYFSDKFRPLPNFSLAIAEVPDDSWEAHVAPGLVLLPSRQWSTAINARLLARTLARLWWAADVSPASAGDAWLAEGLSRYSEALYQEHAGGAGALRQVMEDLTIASLVDESAAPIANADRLPPYSPEYDSVVRDKGAMVVHMLRQVTGDDNFGKLLAAYSQRFAGRRAILDDFQRLAAEIHGQPLDYFFGEWLRSTGVPEFSMDWVIYRTRKGFRVSGQIKQQLEVFRMPVPVRVETEGPPVTQSVTVTGTSTDFSIETFGKPLRTEIDPDFNVLKFTVGLKVRVAIARGESLFQRGKFYEATREYQRAIDIKRNSSLAYYRMGEAFFEQGNYQAAANAFREATAGDVDPPWTLVWSRIFLGKIFDITGQRERAINEYRRALEVKEITDDARAEAERYLREPYRRETRPVQEIERR